MAKITLATIKSFIRRNAPYLHIRFNSHFDGMVDGIAYTPESERSFRPVTPSNRESMYKNDLGISGAWFVRCSGNYFSPLSENGYTGYHVSNCCGSFDIAIPVGVVRVSTV